MKKSVKRLISLLVCCAILLTGCGTSSTSLPSELAAQKTDNILGVVNILAPSSFFSTEDENSAAEKAAWLEEISLKYEVRINIVSDSFSAETNQYSYDATAERYRLLRGSETFSGLVEVNLSQLHQAVEQGIALPLEDYLADNQAWNALPDSVKSAFSIDGHIYAIPASCMKTVKARTITDDSLAQTGITVTDLDSLKNFALTYTKTTGNYAISSDGLANLVDILNAFGLYPGEDASLPFAYDSLLNSVVDFLCKDEAVTALEYLRELYNAGALKINFDASEKTAFSDFDSGICASYYGDYQDYDDCAQVLTLNANKPQMVFKSQTGYFLTTDTPQPKETVNLLVDMLFGSEENYLDCWLGSSGNYTLNSDGTITVEKSRSSDGNYVVPARPDLVRYLPDVFDCSQAGIIYSENGITDTTVTGSGQYPEVFDQLVDRHLIQETRSVWGYGKKAAYVYAYQNDIDTLYSTCIKDAITDNSRTVEQIVKTYKKSMLDLGGNSILDMMNSMSCTHAAYYYYS